MRPAPANYAPYTDVRKVNMRVTFELIDLQSAELAVPSVSGKASISQLAQLTDRVEVMYGKFPTLEKDFWPLNGSMNILPDSFSGLQTGWFSSVASDLTGVFVNAPTLTFTFSEDISSIGFTLVFDSTHGQWPTRFHVSTYSATDALISEATVTNDSAQCVVSLLSPGYRKVVFTFYETSEPYRRVRVCECLFGIIQHFDKNTLSNATLTYGADGHAESLPSREMTFTFDNSDQKYNLINPQGIYAYLQEGQHIDAELCIGDIDWVTMGRFFFASASAEDEALTATITASDKMLWLDGSVCRIGTTGTWTLSAAIAAVLSSAGASIQTDIPADIGVRTVGRQIPQDASHREALRLLSQAARCTCWIARDGTLVFRDLALGTVCDALTRDNMKSMNGISVSERINTIELSVQDPYVEGSAAVVYIATNRDADESTRAVSLSNPCAYSGQAVVDWLLNCYLRRLKYALQYRGNPLLEIGDTVSVESAYGDTGECVLTGIELIYNGGLSGKIEGQGGVWA